MFIDEMGVHFSDDKKTLIKFPRDFRGIYIVPEGVTTIAEDSFNSCRIDGIAFPEGFKSIKGFAFDHYIEYFFLPSSLTEFGSEIEYPWGWSGFDRCCQIFVPEGNKERMLAQFEGLRDFLVIELSPTEMIEYPLSLREDYKEVYEHDEIEDKKRILQRIYAKKNALAREALLPEWEDYVAKIRTAIENGARNLVVIVSSYLLGDTMGEKAEDYEMAVRINSTSGSLAKKILKFLEAKETPVCKFDFGLTREDVEKAIEEGDHTLYFLNEYLHDRYKYDKLKTFCNETYDHICESPEPYFYADVENGFYHLLPDGKGHEGKPDFNACRETYLDWVKTNSMDPFFMEERARVEDNLNNYVANIGRPFHYIIVGIE